MEAEKTINALIAAAALAAMTASAAQANDTSAVLGAGGLELTTSEDITMADEALYLSPKEVRVRYVFRNESDHDITTTVAFPLPDVDQSDDGEMVFLPVEGHGNFVDFQVAIDGHSIQPKLEQKAIAADGTDVTATLAKAGLPADAKLPGWGAKVRALPDATRQQLLRHGIIESDDPGNRSASLSPAWKLRTVFHWEQTFPAGKAINVEHRYKPIVGGVSIFADEGQFNDYGGYCLDERGKAGVRRLLKQARAASQADPQKPSGLSPLEVGYILTTGANWKGPIGNFHLTIDKERPDAILSLCMDGLTKTGPTTFEMTQTNFMPKKDIRFVVFKSPQ